jgi:acyl-CoA thioesterase I
VRRGALNVALRAAIFGVLGGITTAGLCAQTSLPLKLVVLGDSLTAGYGLPANQAFPQVLQQDLRAHGWSVQVVNAGVSGDTASDGLARLDWSIGADPNAVLIELGANDMLRGVDPAVTKKALEAILARLQDRRIPAMLAGMFASPTLGQTYVEAFQRIYPSLARERGIPLYPFFLEGVAGSPGLELPDGMHPNAKGVRVIAASILPAVEQFLGSVVRKRLG